MLSNTETFMFAATAGVGVVPRQDGSVPAKLLRDTSRRVRTGVSWHSASGMVPRRPIVWSCSVTTPPSFMVTATPVERLLHSEHWTPGQAPPKPGVLLLWLGKSPALLLSHGGHGCTSVLGQAVFNTLPLGSSPACTPRRMDVMLLFRPMLVPG